MPRFAASLGALGCIASASAFLGGQLAPRRAFAPRMSASVAGTSQDVEGLEAGMPFSLLGDAGAHTAPPSSPPGPPTLTPPPSPPPGISVSAAALGTADWGHGRLATDAAVAEMLEVALKFGVNFVDTSELWPHPWDPAEAGKGQAMLGRWLAANADKRDGLVIGASVAGYSDRVDYLPRLGDAGGTRLSAAQLTAAVDDALERLQTDRIELLTLQWPERYVKEGAAAAGGGGGAARLRCCAGATATATAPLLPPLQPLLPLLPTHPPRLPGTSRCGARRTRRTARRTGRTPRPSPSSWRRWTA